ncbi:hypothetical protein [Actinoplanes sp. L3-i22]|uniref:Ig-like domain-containing protein n=1 Tax=Actinoplanes sp. L3-i22 TaxID=2836373 RepID=UPI001C768582|nr:hypothetical protein [Actinoplanes sp. L3-i22]BCY09111.1 hypothetical protein L3i22_041990 [Actinoplanes sp. L3-i22]
MTSPTPSTAPAPAMEDYLSPAGRMPITDPATAARMMAAKQAHLADSQGRRSSGVEWALVGTVVERQVRESLKPWLGNVDPFIDAGLRWLPLLLLQPAKRGNGISGLVTDPRVISFVAMAGLVGGGQLLKKAEEERRRVRDLSIVRYPTELTIGESFKLRTDAPADEPLEWRSSHDEVAAVDPAGVLTAKSSGATTITVSRDGKSDLVSLRVRD